MPTLFLLCRSDPTRRELTFRLADSGDAVVLVPDRAVGISSTIGDGEINDLTQRGVRILALNASLGSGISGTRKSVQNIGYDQLVDLLIHYDRVYS